MEAAIFCSMTLTGKAVGRCRGAEPNCGCCGVANKKPAAQLLPLPGALSLRLVERVLFYSPVNCFHRSLDSCWILLTLMWLILLRLVILLAWEKKRYQHACATRLCVEEEGSTVIPCGEVQWWQGSGLPWKEVWAGSTLRTFLPIAGGG